MASLSNTTSSLLSFNFIQPVKLDRINYLVWKIQVLASITGNGVEGCINGDKPCSSQFLHESNAEFIRSNITTTRTENPEYITWKKTDKLLQRWMFSSMIESVLIMVINCETSQELWRRLAEIFMSQFKARFMPFMMQL